MRKVQEEKLHLQPGISAFSITGDIYSALETSRSNALFKRPSSWRKGELSKKPLEPLILSFACVVLYICKNIKAGSYQRKMK